MSWCSCSVRCWKRATLVLAVLSLMLLLLISSALRCDLLDREEGVQPRGQRGSRGQGGSGRPQDKRKYAEEDVVHWFAKAVPSTMERTAPQPSCSQAQTNESHSASLLVIGSFNLTTSADQLADQLAQLRRAVDVLPDVGNTVATLVSPLQPPSDATVSPALSLLRSGGMELVSLATERLYSSGDRGLRATTQQLEAAGIRWLGVTSKEENIVMLGGLRVGFLAYCAVHGECVDSTGLPFAPVRYSSKLASSAVGKLRARGADAVVVLVRWGRGGSYYPDETSLSTSRYLASLGVTLVLGSHPLLQQHHAYFGDTLVIFSAGDFFRPSTHPQLCWQPRGGGKVQYSISDHCSRVHPSLHSSLLDSEQHSTLYHIQLSGSSPAVADYVRVPLQQRGMFQLPEPIPSDLPWTQVCGQQDTNCLACDPL